MQKVWVSIVSIVAVLGAILFLVNVFSKSSEPTVAPRVSSHKDATYVLDGTPVTLKNGVSEVLVTPDSETKTVTQFYGNETFADLNNDGTQDVVFILTQTTGGSGTFYYLVPALDLPDGYHGGTGLLLGDRITPLATEIGRDNTLVVNYADRKPDESFATPPSVGTTLVLKLDVNTLQFETVETQ